MLVICVIVFCSVTHSDLAGNVFASLDKDLSASSDDDEESAEDRQPPELELDPENSSAVGSDELANGVWENVDEASIDEDDDNDVEDENEVTSVGGCGGSDHGESDVETDADDDNSNSASDISGKLNFTSCACFSVFLSSLRTPG